MALNTNKAAHKHLAVPFWRLGGDGQRFTRRINVRSKPTQEQSSFDYEVCITSDCKAISARSAALNGTFSSTQDVY
jgi:hypothetical protein